MIRNRGTKALDQGQKYALALHHCGFFYEAGHVLMRMHLEAHIGENRPARESWLKAVNHRQHAPVYGVGKGIGAQDCAMGAIEVHATDGGAAVIEGKQMPA